MCAFSEWVLGGGEGKEITMILHHPSEGKGFVLGHLPPQGDISLWFVPRMLLPF